VDIFIVLDPHYFNHYNNQNSGPAGLLDYTKRLLLKTYTSTPDISRNGQAVSVRFADFVVDVVVGFILSNTNLVPAPDAERSPSIYRLGWYQSDYMGRYVEVALSLKMGKRLNSDQVHKIVAAEFCVSVSKVKRVLSAREEAESSD
jgi:hypothetical protein